jgi:hypothetical protein
MLMVAVSVLVAWRCGSCGRNRRFRDRSAGGGKRNAEAADGGAAESESCRSRTVMTESSPWS